MLLFREIGLADLARLCRRLATSLDAGLDLRKVLDREAERTSGQLAANLRSISQAVGDGDTLEDALTPTGAYFPPLFRRLLSVGERTGNLPEVLRQLAEHYETQLTLRRELRSRLAWPVTQLIAAIGIVGFLIWILGVIAEMTRSPSRDILGLGLVGTPGAIVYFASIAGFAVSCWLGYTLLRRSLTGTQALDRTLLAIPMLGPALRTLALSRMAWTLHLTDDTGMDLREAVPLALASTDNACFTAQTGAVLAEIESGHPLSNALAQAGGYPTDFLDTLTVGEDSGQVSESMARLARHYREEAARAMATLTMLFGFAIWAVIATLMVLVILRIFYAVYLGPLNEALEMAR